MRPPGTFRPFPRAALDTSLVARFEEQVAERPDAIAVLQGPGDCLTYEELNRRANRVAWRILRAIGDGEEPVALLADQGIEAVVGILGALKAGKIYVPLDPSHPPPRLEALVADCGARLIVVDGDQARPGVRAVGDPRRCLFLGDGQAGRGAGNDGIAGEGTADRNPGVAISADRAAYVFYTSGSTGVPKGVVDSHRNVLHNVMRYTNHLGLGPEDRLTLLQSPVFSGTVSSLFGALLNGAAVCPFRLAREGFAALATWLNETGITVYHSVPALFRGFLGGQARFPAVRVVRLEGDQALPSDVALFRRHFAPDCVLAVGLGATETGLSCQLRVTARDAANLGAIVPVGYPTEDFAVSIVDQAGRDAGPLEPGEIVVRSRYLAVGYWRRPELTARAFLSDPEDPTRRRYRTGDRGRRREDGCVEFLGRLDARPKVRGEFVEIADVEAALSRVRGVAAAAAVIREETPGDARLTAYLVREAGFAPTLATVRESLATELTGAMMPTAIVFLPALPLTAHGKVDRGALPAPGSGLAHEGEQPPREGGRGPDRDSREGRLAALWEGVLGRPVHGAEAHFFELGGDSLRAARLGLLVEQEFGTRLPPDRVAELGTLGRMASWLRGESGEWQSTPGLIPFRSRAAGGRPPLFCLHDHRGSVAGYAALARHLGDDQPCYGVAATDVSAGGVPASLEELATRYLEALRSLQPVGPYRLAGLCFGGVVAFEIGRQLIARGESVAFLGLIGVTPYDFPGLVAAPASRLYRLHRDRARWTANLRYHAARLRMLRAGEKWRYARARLGSVLPYLRARWRRRRDSGRSGGETPGGVTVAGGASALAELHSRLFRAYRARPFPGRPAVMLSRETTALYSADPEADWQGVGTRGAEVWLADVGEAAMLQEPCAARLGAWMRERLVDAGCGS